MKTYKFNLKFIRAICFVTLCAVLFVNVQHFFLYEHNSHPTTISLRYLYKLPKNSIDVFGIGPSSFYHSFSPMELYGKYGWSVWSCGTSNQNLISTYYILNEVLKRQTPKVVVMEAPGLFYNTNEPKIREIIDWLHFSRNKLDFIEENAENPEADPFDSMVLPILKFHTRWKEINRDDLIPFDKNYLPETT